jgi:signal transduction histidine kinase
MVFERARAAAPRLSFYVPLALVSMALALLAVVPLVEQRRMATRLDELSHVIDPGRIATSEVQVAVALEAAGMRGYLLTEEERYAATHHQARSDRTRAYARLRELSTSLDPGHAAKIVALDALFQEADSLFDQFFAGQMTRDGFLSHLSSQQTRFIETMVLTNQLLHDLRDLAATRRNEVRQIQQTGSYLSMLGVLVALAAVVSVARMSAMHSALAASERVSREQAERAKAEAEQRREDAERIGASRTGLMRGFSHDVNNALGVADGHLFMLEQGVRTALNAAQREGIAKARRSLRTAIQLIDDLLEVARAEAGGMTLHLRRLDLRELVAGVIDDYRMQADERGLAIDVDVPASSPLIDSDADRVTQILSNLMSNAVKYTADGRVTVRVGMRHDERGRSWAVVDVADTGPGIPDDARVMIFDEFRRLDISGGRKGTGIGLAISARLAVALGGRITVESAVGRGSVFTLWLPVNRSE